MERKKRINGTPLILMESGMEEPVCLIQKKGTKDSEGWYTPGEGDHLTIYNWRSGAVLFSGNICYVMNAQWPFGPRLIQCDWKVIDWINLFCQEESLRADLVQLPENQRPRKKRERR